MKEEIRQEIQKKIAEKFDQALGPKPRAPKLKSEEERQERTAQYADWLIKAALEKL